MNLSEILQNFIWLGKAAKPVLTEIGIFIIFILLSFLVGRYTPLLIRLILKYFFPPQLTVVYEKLIHPIKNLFKIASTFILISFSLNLIKEYELIYNFIKPFIDLAVIASVAWITSRLFRQFVLVYGIDLFSKFGREVDELLLVFETLANVIIGFFAVLAFAKNRFDLVGLVTGLGIAGVAVAFAAQKTLEQLLGTIVLYLDRPFVPGEYIRLQRSQQISEGLFGRVESIGLRSTKIRTAAKSTLFIVPNSILANLEVE